MPSFRSQVLVIGSGAGGAVTAATLAEAGREVILLEEGPDVDTSAMATNTPEAMRLLYRHGGLNPILGKPTQAFIEGCCVGGSTEINSAFWHRTPPDVLDDWSRRFAIAELGAESLRPLFEEIERELGVCGAGEDRKPASSILFRRGAEKLGWPCQEVPRAQPGHLAGSAYEAGAKRAMRQTYVLRALKAGARLIADCRAVRLDAQGDRVTRVRARGGGSAGRLEIVADTVFVCGGAIQTPVLLQASGLRKNIGRTLHLHPMLKVAAQFDVPLDSHRAALPVYQIKGLAPGLTLGGAVFTPGFLALTLSDNWLENRAAMEDWRRMALYYASWCGRGGGAVRRVPGSGEAMVRYRFSEEDRRRATDGLRRLCEVLFAAGARRVFPGIRSRAVFSGFDDVREFLREPLPLADISLSVLHVFGSCPMGEDRGRCAVNSFGRVHGFSNLWINDASILPDAPGVNPQGTIMAVALRNARAFAEDRGP